MILQNVMVSIIRVEDSWRLIKRNKEDREIDGWRSEIEGWRRSRRRKL